MRRVEHWIEEAVGLPAAAQEDILLSVVVLAVLWISSRLLLRVASQRQTDSRKLYQWQKTTN